MISDRAAEVFLEARTLDPETRTEFVNTACAGNEDLLGAVESLLAASNDSENYFEKLAGKVGLNVLANDDAALPANKLIGSWRLLKRIGRGGMGAVYLAERADEQFEQQAALKILPTGMDSDQARARFLIERQILARLTHDNIARLLDGGVTDEGVPYFVMDYVEGLPIDDYCSKGNLDIREKLALILDIARAVQFAHRNLIIHRDLKPSNVLVDDSGRVRLLDFGIAKMLFPDAVNVQLTQQSRRPATPAFASPEMLRGEPVDATTDVYSIGALMYVLLTGQLPLVFDGLSLSEMYKQASDNVPNLVSRVDPSLKGDVDAIVGKALAKLPEERYESVESLANDIRNYLDGLPVAAKAPSTVYRTRKFLARHRFGASFVAFAILSLTGITALAVYSAITAEEQSRTIALERDRAEEVRDFLTGIFNSANPNVAAADMTAREILDVGRQRIATDLADQPELQVDLAMTIGEVYATIRMTDEWREMLEMEIELRRDLSGTENVEYVDVLFGMSQLEDMSGNYDESQAYAEEALAITERLDHKLGQAFAHKRIGRVLHLKGDYEAANAAYRAALAINEAEQGPRDIETNEVRMHLSTLLNHQEKYGESLNLLEQVLAIRQEHYPGDHGEYSEVFLAMGSVYTALERYAEAKEIYERSFAMNDRLFGPDNRRNLFIVAGLGKLAQEQGDYTVAAERYLESIRMTAMFFPDHPNLGIAIANLGKTYTLDGRFDLALPEYRKAVDILERKLPDHWSLGDVRWRLGRTIVQTNGDLAEAETLILTGLETLMAQWGPNHKTTRGATAAAAELYDAWDKPTEAVKYRIDPKIEGQ